MTGCRYVVGSRRNSQENRGSCKVCGYQVGHRSTPHWKAEPDQLFLLGERDQLSGGGGNY